MTSLHDYLRDEIDEEARLGYLSAEEGARRVGLLDGATGPAAAAGDGAEPDAFDDGAVTAAWTEFAGATGPLDGYLAGPATGPAGSSLPGVLVVHENKGVTPYIRDVTRRLATAGFVALAPDLLSGVGGTRSFADPAAATAALGKLTPEDMVADLKAAVGHLTTVSNGTVGALGFCFGGGMVWRLATQDPRLRGAVPFYGPNPPLADVPAIAAPVFAVYGALDARITGGLPDIEAAMTEHGRPFEKMVLPDAQHAFHNDTNPDRYHPEAAARAWSAALDHLDAWLR
jgi:carboxymethylenebutenolidase